MHVYSIENIKLDILKSNPAKLSIIAKGLVTSTGWKNSELKPLEKTLSADGILDLEFIATPPSPGEIVRYVLTDTVADYIWEDEVDRIFGVRIVARTNEKTQLLHTLEPQDVWPWPWRNSQLPVTTLAIGEETPFPSQIPFPQKWFIGETNPASDIHKPTVGEKPPFGEDFNRLDALSFPSNPFGTRK